MAAPAPPRPTTAFKTTAVINTFGGQLHKLTHASDAVGCDMAVSLFLPPGASADAPAPLLWYLSGLTCTPDNCAEKGFLHAHAARLGLAVAYPDTSPRGLGLAGEAESWDFGVAASFYLDAVKPPFDKNYRMETYLTDELPGLLFDAFGELDRDRQSITGHSMGGHGALTLYLRHPGAYKSVSAFAPIANPSNCPWGVKAFNGYLGDDRSEWAEHDATELVGRWKGSLNCLIDVGTGDKFYNEQQLLPEHFAKAVEEAGIDGLTLRYQDGYDHSYFFISTFGQDHVEHAAKFLRV